MALQSFAFPEPFVWGLIGAPNSSMGARGTLDAAGEYHALSIRARENMSISHVAYSPAAVSGSPTADIRIETVDASTGQPSGALWATNTNVVTGTLSASTLAVHALTATANINAGDLFAVKIAYNSGTSFNIYSVDGVANTPVYGLAWTNTGTPGTANYNWPIALGNSATTFYQVPQCWPISAHSSVSINNTTAGTRRGFKFRVPFTARASGIVWSKIFTGSMGDVTADLYSDGGTLLTSSSTFDCSAAPLTSHVMIPFTTPQTLSPNTWYRAVLTPTSSTNTTIYHMTTSNSIYISALQHNGNYHLTTHTTADGWVDTTTTFPLMGIAFDQLSDGVGGSGGASFAAFS